MFAIQVLIVNAILALLFKEHSLADAKFVPQNKVKFMVKNVSNEFIIKFHFKYSNKVRESFIQKRLSKAKVSINIYLYKYTLILIIFILHFQASNWSIVPRYNLASKYPSDFDILRITDANILIESIIKSLNEHPAVKAVTAQQRITRFLPKSLNETVSHNNRRIQGVARRKGAESKHVSVALHAEALWKLGITGKGVKVGIFDTGLTHNHPHFRNVKERTNWTNEKSLDDGVSHGTFVAGVIASSKECLGLAPDAELHIYKVFTNSQVTSDQHRSTKSLVKINKNLFHYWPVQLLKK